MKHFIASLFALTGITSIAQNSILDLAEGYHYEISIPFSGDTIVHLPYVDLPTQMQLGVPHRVIEDRRGHSNIYYWKGWRISYHTVMGQRSATTITRVMD